MEIVKTDLCIIGAGSGGLSLAAGAAQMGARVVLIEGAAMGGDCLNHGCVPSKTLLAAAKAAQAVRLGAAGVTGAEPEIDFAAVKAQVAATIAQIAPMDSQQRFEGFGVQVIRAYGRFSAPDAVEAGGKLIKARRFVIATGSHPLIPAVPGLETIAYLTNETLFAQTERPAHLLILGAGPVALEMAQAHRRLGCNVTVIARSRALGRDDPEAAAVVVEALRADGVAFSEGHEVMRFRTVPEGVEAVLADGATLIGSHLLVAAGRAPAIARLDLAAAAVAFTEKGVTVGPNLRTSNRRIYAVGDVTGGMQFTHVAGAHAGVVIRQVLLGLPAKQANVVPWVTYTDPELAQVGLTEAQARKLYPAVQVIRQDFQHNDRAVTEAKAKGFLKLMLVKGRPVGATIVGPQAGELIGLWALALSSGLKIGAVAGMIAPYPTLGEISKRAAGAYYTPKLFDNLGLKRFVRFVQRMVP